MYKTVNSKLNGDGESNLFFDFIDSAQKGANDE